LGRSLDQCVVGKEVLPRQVRVAAANENHSEKKHAGFMPSFRYLHVKHQGSIQTSTFGPPSAVGH
jgi:hypothetical protein